MAMDFTIEELSMNAWPAIQTVLYDGWIIRFAQGYSNRSNSINPIYPSKIDTDRKIAYGERLFAAYNLPATYKLLGCREHAGLEKRLDALNYQPINLTSVQSCGELEILKKDYEGMIIKDHFDDKWMESVIEFNAIQEAHQPVFKKIVKSIGVEKIVVRKETEAGTAACGYGTMDNAYVGVFDIVVKESERGKGYGREMVKTILSEGRKRGSERSFLQVMENNPIAKNLYAKLGYKEIYKYWYRKKIRRTTLIEPWS